MSLVCHDASSRWGGEAVSDPIRLPRRVQQCRLHHVGCACREWHHEQMAQALRIIQTWAICDHLSHETRRKAMANIAQKCAEALNTVEGR